MGDIFIVVDGQPDGPYEAVSLRARLASGELPRDTHASREGDDRWMPLTELIGEVSGASTESSPPIAEAKLRTGAWIALGALLLAAFIFPTPMNDGWGVVNLQTGWVSEHLGWTPIPLMLWPAGVGAVAIAAGLLLHGRGRARGALGILLALLPVLLLLILGGGVAAKGVEMIAELQETQLADLGDKDKMKGMFSSLLASLGSLGATAFLVVTMLAGAFASMYATALLVPAAVRALRPESKGAYYAGLVGGIILIILQLVLLLISVPMLLANFVQGAGMLLGAMMHMAAVIIAFTNTPGRAVTVATRRARWSLGLGLGGFVLYGLAILLSALLADGMQQNMIVYIFKIWLWFGAAALVLPLALADLWLGKTVDAPADLPETTRP